MDQSVRIGQSATFTVAASGAQPLNYQWQRNDANISGATSSSYTLTSASAADDGAAFQCVVSNSSGAATSNPAYLHISGNNPPAGTITSPTGGTLYSAGQTIQFAGSATDPEDGALPPSAYSWTIVFHHDTHTHPFLGPINGVTSDAFVVPTQGETSANVWYRITLTVTDSAGQTQTSFVDVRPRTARISLATSPPGLQVTLDGQPLTTPVSVLSVVGMSRTLGVASSPLLGGARREFVSWSDGGGPTHVIATPATDTIYTAKFREPTPNSAPTISDIADQSTKVNTATAAIPFTVKDAETPAWNLMLKGSSSNPTLVPQGNIVFRGVFGGTGADRTVTVTPAANQTGTATITVTVSDGALTASDTFVVRVDTMPTGLLAASASNEDPAPGPGFTGNSSGGVASKLLISLLRSDENGLVQLRVEGEIGQTYSMEASNDLIHWTKAAVQENPMGEIVFIEPAAGPTSRFYRAVVVPR